MYVTIRSCIHSPKCYISISYDSCRKVGKVVEVKKQSRAKRKNVKDCHALTFEVELDRVEENREQTYSTYITITNLHTLESTLKSFNQLSGVYEILELEECNNPFLTID